jgi:cobaltochelatase CobS
VYLFGGAGTGKTYVTEQLADFLGYKYYEVNCNQFTSPLDLIGGQTIDGYQKGRLEMAWTNEDEKGNPFDGAILCLDELPKLDPNTAGLLNAALAKIKNVGPGKTPFIYNGKGEKIFLKNMMVIGTGNTKLNETSVEYEANFKQDLSLQDRFVGATYEVLADYRSEYDVAMRDFAFLWIFMTKMREYILENRLTGFAFVSIRIMMSLRDTYVVYKDSRDQVINPEYSISTPKTLKQGLDSFLNLFKENQVTAIKAAVDYDNFVNVIIPSKETLPLGSLNTPDELKQVEKMIKANEKLQNSKTA